MEYYRIIPDNKVAIVDAEQFEEIEKQSKLNSEEIEKRAKELYQNYLKNTGIDIKIKYLTDKLYNDLVRVDYGENGYWVSNQDPLEKQVKDKLIDSIVKDVNKRVYPIRKEIVENITSKLNYWEKRSKVWFNIFLYSNILWACAIIILLCLCACK